MGVCNPSFLVFEIVKTEDSSFTPGSNITELQLTFILRIGNRRSSMARCERVSKFPIRRETDWCPHSHQSPSASVGRKLRCLGRVILDV